MARTITLSCVALSVLLAAPPAIAAKAPDTWDNLILVKSKKLEGVYLLPNADFRAYTKVMLDPTQVAFKKNWLRDVNDSTAGLRGNISNSDATAIANEARTGFDSIFAKAYADAGYQVVTAPGPDVLRLSTAVINLYLTAPDQLPGGRTQTYSAEAGEATIVIEARDSLTGAVMGRAVDRQTAGDFADIRTRVSNRADFEMLFKSWAKASAQGLNELKAMSPIDVEGRPPTP